MQVEKDREEIGGKKMREERDLRRQSGLKSRKGETSGLSRGLSKFAREGEILELLPGDRYEYALMLKKGGRVQCLTSAKIGRQNKAPSRSRKEGHVKGKVEASGEGRSQQKGSKRGNSISI